VRRSPSAAARSGDAEPKYLNTSTTPVYTKGRYLFALNVARRAAAKEDSVIVVEGYLDCIALHQAGFTNAVAALGTAFTPDQAKELRKVAARAVLCFDADAAGVDASLKSIGDADRRRRRGVDAAHPRREGPRRVHPPQRRRRVSRATGRSGVGDAGQDRQ